MFEEAGVKVPTTWEQLKEVSRPFRSITARTAPFTAIALGAKEEWPDYPFMEFSMRALGALTMARTE